MHSALTAETFALKSAMESALVAKFSSIQFCSDSQILVSLLLSGEDTNELKGLLFDIRSLWSLFNSISICFVSRSVNVLADALAKTALKTMSLNFCTGG